MYVLAVGKGCKVHKMNSLLPMIMIIQLACHYIHFRDVCGEINGCCVTMVKIVDMERNKVFCWQRGNVASHHKLPSELD